MPYPRIGHGLKLAGTPDKVVGVPLIAVIEIDILFVCNCQASALGNVDLNARQQSAVWLIVTFPDWILMVMLLVIGNT